MQKDCQCGFIVDSKFCHLASMQLEIDSLISRCNDVNHELLSQFDPDLCIEFFDRVPHSASYHFVPDGVSNMWQNVVEVYGSKGFATFQEATMLRLMSKFESRSTGRQYTDGVRQCFSTSFRRILDSIRSSDFTSYSDRNDILLKDLAICRQKMFPAGAQVVEPDSSFHRSAMLLGGISQAYRMARLLLRSGGNNHWYQIHTHLSELVDFNPEGWDQCYLRLADMLARNVEIRGMWGGSWFYDPALETISPRLTYLRKVPQENGACVFYSNVDIDGGALAKSASRNKAYEAGQYIPKSYLVIWPRADLIRWAKAVRQSM